MTREIVMLLGTKENPVSVRVATIEHADRVHSICREHEIEVVVAIEHDQPENYDDLQRVAVERLQRVITRQAMKHVNVARSQLAASS